MPIIHKQLLKRDRRTAFGVLAAALIIALGGIAAFQRPQHVQALEQAVTVISLPASSVHVGQAGPFTGSNGQPAADPLKVDSDWRWSHTVSLIFDDMKLAVSSTDTLAAQKTLALTVNNLAAALGQQVSADRAAMPAPAKTTASPPPSITKLIEKPAAIETAKRYNIRPALAAASLLLLAAVNIGLMVFRNLRQLETHQTDD